MAYSTNSRLTWFFVFSVWICAISIGHSQSPLITTFGSKIEDIKAAAEQGDPKAQYQLGQAYYSHLDWTNALTWYRKSAKNGYADAQYSLGAYIIGSNGRMKQDGVRWVLLAANQNHAQAQIKAGDMYFDGKLLQRDYVEAYKWYSLGLRELWVWKGKLDAAVLKMSQEQIDEGKTRVAKFIPQQTGRVLPEIKLQGISGKEGKQLAIINGQTFSKGESANIKFDDELYRVHCIDIGDRFTVIQVNGENQNRTLTLQK